MRLSLHKVVPVPLRDRMQQRSSGIWLSDVQYEGAPRLFVKAPSGTGKTTLIHMLYGLRNDYEGAVMWDDMVMREAGAQALAQLRSSRLSIIFQDMRLFPELTAWENLDIKRRLSGPVTEQQVMQWLERLGMTHKKDALAATLSYGEQQRIAIIRALLQPFEWLLMDEPFSHLDSSNKSKAAALIAEVAAQHNAALLLADLDDNNYFSYTQTLVL